jgi:acetolactate decarboxylase
MAPIAPGPGVRWIGAQRDVLGGDLGGHVELEALSALPHLYGLGPLEELRGEISIFRSVPSIARIERETVETVVTAASWRARACFLVWAQVPAWFEQKREAIPDGLDGIERAVVSLAREVGLDPDWPLPFRICATALEATFHVLDKRDGLAHNPERHEQAKVRRTLERAEVELVGFYSRHHRGIFTPRESNVHVHLRTADGRISGHLEMIQLAPGTLVAVPVTGWNQ